MARSSLRPKWLLGAPAMAIYFFICKNYSFYFFKSHFVNSHYHFLSTSYSLKNPAPCPIFTPSPHNHVLRIKLQRHNPFTGHPFLTPKIHLSHDPVNAKTTSTQSLFAVKQLNQLCHFPSARQLYACILLKYKLVLLSLITDVKELGEKDGSSPLKRK